MALFDMARADLEGYRPTLTAADDFDAFWQEQLAAAREHDLAATFEPYDAGLALIEAFDVTFAGYGGQPVKGWLSMPRDRRGPVPCVVEYIGYGGGRGFPHNYLLFAAAGYAHFVMDTRGQGSYWQKGDTPDIDPWGDPSSPGFMTRGLRAPERHYYTRVYTDAVRAVAAARAHPDVDGRVVVVGMSQGGGLSIAAAGLVPDLSGAYADQPFMCHFERGARITDSTPYAEIAHYLRAHSDEVEQTFRTLSYVDGMNHAARANAPARFSVGLMDIVCPPSTVFAAYNHYAGEKSIQVYDFNQHDGGQTFGVGDRLAFVNSIFGT